jgi:hypothetical protein
MRRAMRGARGAAARERPADERTSVRAVEVSITRDGEFGCFDWRGVAWRGVAWRGVAWNLVRNCSDART